MGLADRPYVGTWRLNGKELIQHTPDALVYINGDTSVPGCPKCNGRIDLQQFLTEVSVDAGTEPGSASASFTLAIPLHHTDSFARDANFILHPGLEVHVYMRGFFPVKGLYKHLAERRVTNKLGAGDVALPSAANVVEVAVPEEVAQGFDRMKLDDEQRGHAALIYSEFTKAGYTPAFAVAGILQAYSESGLRNIQQVGGPGLGLFQLDPGGLGKATPKFREGRSAGTADTTTTYNAFDPLTNIQREIVAVESIGGNLKKTAVKPDGTVEESFKAFFGSPTGLGARDPAVLPKKNSKTSYTIEEWHQKWDNGFAKRSARGRRFFPAAWSDPKFNERALAAPSSVPDSVAPATTVDVQIPAISSATAQTGSSLLDELGLPEEVADVMAYPYYHVFHGVVTEVGHSYSGGVSTVTVNCSSLLHFWQYQNMSTNASVFGARPLNSGNKMSMVGHNFTGMHPYQIIYTLHHDMVGAAGGVGWALSQKTNQTAKSEIGGESLYSLNVRYWEKRFQGRMAKLRMHGATGELFTTMQAAWLGRTSSAALMSLFRQRFNTAKGETQPGNIFGQALSVGLVRRQRLESILRKKGINPDDHSGASLESGLWAYRNQGTKGNEPSFEINIVEMQAFVSNIGNWGQVNLFESSYESKLDIANKVCDVTGFEFYQDVDGDFVFKPPMYNLDTSASRVYRIEDIDIINIQFSEKEPQVTYMTVKGSSVVQKNLEGTGTENEWGIRGQYIDFRLVAQFGWRPGSYETAYFTDPRAMFFAAVNRMDIMNAGTNSATVTIPLRPELRPGYPVYIPYVDAFYYCNSFAHSYSVGGQCTTTLQLIAKRAKFFAPGNPSLSGIDSIDLGKTTLPPRPLEVLDPEGKPRLAGFPNVVMALDPAEVNPLFFVVGADIERLDDPRVLRWLLKMGANPNFRILTEEPQGTDSSLYLMDVPLPGGGVKKVAFFFQEGNEDPPDALPAAPEGRVVVNTLKEGKEYQQLLEARAKEASGSGANSVSKIQGQIEEAQGKLNALRQQQQQAKDEDKGKFQADIDATYTKIAGLEAQKSALTDKLGAAGAQAESEWKDPNGKHQGVAFLLDMVRQVGERFRTLGGNERFKDLNSTINLLDMLSDKKATFTNGTLPGVYRYYSASHPDVPHQAPQVLNYSTEKRFTLLPPLTIKLDEGDEISKVKTFTRHPAAAPNGRTPEAGFADEKPKVGIRVLNSNPHFKYGQVVPTSDIMELMFSPAKVKAEVKKTSTKRRKLAAPFGLDRAKQIHTSLFTTDALGGPPSPETAMSAYFEPSLDKLNELIDDAMVASIDLWPDGIAVEDAPLRHVVIAGLTGRVGPYPIPWDEKFGAFKYSGSSGQKSLGPVIAKSSLTDLANKLGEALGILAVNVINANYAETYEFLTKLGHPHDDVLQWLSAFVQKVSGVAPTAPPAPAKDRVQGTVLGNFTTEAPSPVFPVSDASGYTVIGSYRYGRGVNIDPQGVFNQIHNLDVFSLLDKTAVDQVLRFFVQRKGQVKLPLQKKKGPDGKELSPPVWEPTQGGEMQTYTGADAASALNTEVIRQLRMANLTDKQILDYGLAVQNSQDPTQLDFQLANWFADQTKEGIGKLPVINAAFSLADITGLTGGANICECKAAEASVLLNAFGQEDFLPFAVGGQDPTNVTRDGQDHPDDGTRWLAQMTVQASAAWKVGQDALRGQVLDRARSHTVEAFSSLDDRFAAAVKQATENKQSAELKALVKSVGEQARSIGEDKE